MYYFYATYCSRKDKNISIIDEREARAKQLAEEKPDDALSLDSNQQEPSVILNTTSGGSQAVNVSNDKVRMLTHPFTVAKIRENQEWKMTDTNKRYSLKDITRNVTFFVTNEFQAHGIIE